ncbi:hypothetical protein vseg_021730 [Gypsophila vaccaria]
MARPLSSFLLLFYFIITLLQSPSTSSQNSGQFSIGQTLLANSKHTSILSPLGDFAFGFLPLPNSTTLFLLSIWYAKIPDTIVWYANEGNPVTQGSKLTITAFEGLVLSDPHGTPLWNTTDDLSGGGAVSYGYMNDTGNFALVSSSNGAVWQTFDHPTDTLLPTQVLEAGEEVDSRISDTNFTKGRFQLRLLDDGNLVLNTRDVATGFAYGAYYETGTNAATPESSGQKLVYSESGDMYILRNNGSKVDLIQSGKVRSSKDYYQRATLNFDGVLTWYYYPRNSTGGTGVGWSETQYLPDNICMRIASYGGDLDSGACGYNSICSIGNDQKPKCECPPHYSVDPTDIAGSCVPDFKPDECGQFEEAGAKSEFQFISLQNTDWPFADYAKLDPISEEECKNSCLNDCFCAVVIFDGSSCWKKKLPLSNGRQSNTLGKTAWLKVGNVNASYATNNPRKVKYKWNAVVIGLLGGSVCVNLILLTTIFALGILCMHSRKQLKVSEHQKIFDFEYDAARSFTYKMLKSATNGFGEEIGRGSFGAVYKGTITVGGNVTHVAVKNLDRTVMSADKEFTAEVNAIGLTHHKNLVRFIGYCKEADHRLLVYEYMSNGTVSDYLFGELRPSWQSRINIAQGIARGLLYLHEECTTQIIHCDIKPQNVLVDEHYNARISDFGLAKLLHLNQSQTNTAIRGTKGYVAPDWFRNKPISIKVDVYSFGVMLLEIVCCRRSVCMELIEDDRAILTDWAFDCFQSGMLYALVDNDMEALNDVARLERFVKIALWCVQEDPDRRPPMKSVTMMLEGLAEVPSPPCATSFSVSVQG